MGERELGGKMGWGLLWCVRVYRCIVVMRVRGV